MDLSQSLQKLYESITTKCINRTLKLCKRQKEKKQQSKNTLIHQLSLICSARKNISGIFFIWQFYETTLMH